MEELWTYGLKGNKEHSNGKAMDLSSEGVEGAFKLMFEMVRKAARQTNTRNIVRYDLNETKTKRKML